MAQPPTYGLSRSFSTRQVREGFVLQFVCAHLDSETEEDAVAGCNGIPWWRGLLLETGRLASGYDKWLAMAWMAHRNR